MLSMNKCPGVTKGKTRSSLGKGGGGLSGKKTVGKRVGHGQGKSGS